MLCHDSTVRKITVFRLGLLAPLSVITATCWESKFTSLWTLGFLSRSLFSLWSDCQWSLNTWGTIAIWCKLCRRCSAFSLSRTSTPTSTKKSSARSTPLSNWSVLEPLTKLIAASISKYSTCSSWLSNLKVSTFVSFCRIRSKLSWRLYWSAFSTQTSIRKNICAFLKKFTTWTACQMFLIFKK